MMMIWCSNVGDHKVNTMYELIKKMFDFSYPTLKTKSLFYFIFVVKNSHLSKVRPWKITHVLIPPSYSPIPLFIPLLLSQSLNWDLLSNNWRNLLSHSHRCTLSDKYFSHTFCLTLQSQLIRTELKKESLKSYKDLPLKLFLVTSAREFFSLNKCNIERLWTYNSVFKEVYE